MSEERSEAQTSETQPSPGPKWQWALIPAILVGLVGSYVFTYLGVNLAVRFGYVDVEFAAWMLMLALALTLGGLPIAAVGAIIGALVSWPFAKAAARRWGLGRVLLTGVLAGTIGGLCVAAGFVWFVTL